MDKKPKMTIVTPVWNLFKEKRVESFRQTMESVHRQTYSNIEHIVINNNSTDDTQKLIDEYIEKGWCTCHFQPVQGLWHAMQKGYDVATGDFINFMNSDDYFSSNKAVEIAADLLVKENADWFYSDAFRLFEDGHQGRWTADANEIFIGVCPCHQTVWVKMDVMRELGGFDFNYELSLDNHMMMKLVARNKKLAYSNQPLVTFRNGGWCSKKHDFRSDYAQHFYDQLGKSWGMTLEECRSIWMYNTFWEKDEKFNHDLAKKIQRKEWRDFYLKNLDNFLNSSKTTFYLFALVPFLVKKTNRSQTKTKYYLFGTLPIWKITK